MLFERGRVALLGVLKTKIERAKVKRAGSSGLSDKSKLFARVRAGADRVGLPGRSLVPLLHAGSARAHYPGASRQGTDCEGVCVRAQSAHLIFFCGAEPLNSANCLLTHFRLNSSGSKSKPNHLRVSL